MATKPERARFFLESADDEGFVMTLPQSGAHIRVMPKAAFTEHDIIGVGIGGVEMVPCLVFRFTPVATHDLNQLRLANPERRLVLVVAGVPVGARRMKETLDRGWVHPEVFKIFAEVPDFLLPALAASLNETAAALHPPARR